ncbi:hypothetical protein UFOVP1290_285 [uncultured Caudovirales phage]|uniref:Uncharacterized protein n=1 Tax=uncultured Caudovirales phage TaxID=2100421 RepID=A0A6J5RWY4_9CAUD|nr:hypothetical protein UFOVP1290_285 [uncultured Caudovirales phage]
MSKRKLSIDDRWRQGIPHDHRSVKIAKGIAKIDDNENGSSLDLRFGGDGDNGEELLYLLDLYFEDLDNE